MGNGSSEPTEFSDLPPEIRCEVQKYLAPDVFWDQASRHFAEEKFTIWFRRVRRAKNFTWDYWANCYARDRQQFVKCYRFITRFSPVFKFMVPHELLDTPSMTCALRGIPNVENLQLIVDHGGWVWIGGFVAYRGVTKGARRGRNDQIGDKLLTFTGEYPSRDKPIDPDEPLIITIKSSEMMIALAKNRPRGAEVLNRRHLIPAGHLLEALTAWPRQKIGKSYVVLNPS
jgi:hypothetical protein